MYEKRDEMVAHEANHLRNVLKGLISKADIDTNELSAKTGIPVSTIFRMTSGSTNNPQIANIIPLANFFGVTIGQLIGIEPLDEKNDVSANHLTSPLFKIPILSLNQVHDYKRLFETLNTHTHSSWIYTDQVFSSKSYSLIIDCRQYEHHFPKGSIIFIDTSVKLHDYCFAIFTDTTTKISCIKKVFENQSEFLIRHPNETTLQKRRENEVFSGVITGIKNSLCKESY
jgi:transcriptional regulator with XRE-family HTH domain